MEYGYWLAHARGRSSSRRTPSATNGTSADQTLRDGRFIISRDLPLIRIDSMHRNRAAGLDKSFNAPMTVARHGTNPEHPPANRPPPRRACPRVRATSLFTTRLLKPVNPSPRTSGTTAHRTPGSSSASGISNQSLTDPDTVYAGVEDAALFRSTDGGQSWQELSGLRGHGSGPSLAAGRRWDVPAHDPAGSEAIRTGSFIAISSAGAFRTDDAGKTWQPINRGLHSLYIPNPTAEVGHCVHRIAMNRSRPEVLFMQKHWDVMRSDDAGESWQEISGNLPTDFGFAIDVHAHEPDTIYVVPIKSDSEHFPPDGKLRVYRSRAGGNEWEPLTKGLPQSDCYVNVLRDAMAVDSLDKCGMYFGTTGGQVYASADAGDTWAPIVRDLPAVVSVEVQTLP